MARIYVSSVINSEAAKVWERVRDFNGLPKWHPRIRDSRIEDALPADKVGCIRNFNLQNGDNIREQLLGLSVEWSAEFECSVSDEDSLVNGIAGDVFQTGFDALKRHFGG